MDKLLSCLLLGSLLLAYACKKDDHAHDGDIYQIHIHAPGTQDVRITDTLRIRVAFEGQDGATVHHVNVSISEKGGHHKIYSQPEDAHVHATSGKYDFTDHLVLSSIPDLHPGKIWILEASAWDHGSDGHDGGHGHDHEPEGIVKKSVEFRIVE